MNTAVINCEKRGRD